MVSVCVRLDNFLHGKRKRELSLVVWGVKYDWTKK